LLNLCDALQLPSPGLGARTRSRCGSSFLDQFISTHRPYPFDSIDSVHLHMVCLRPPIDLARDGNARPHIVAILHPDYTASENSLLELRALDDGGIDYNTVMAACSIVTGNTTTGFLATRLSSQLEPVARPDDGILREHEYFFQLPDDAVIGGVRPYPIVVRFEDWTFPHSAMPSPWDQLCLGPSSSPLSPSCRITDSRWGMQRAHLVPLGAQEWWDRERLRRYVATDRFSQKSIDASDNTINLRSDIHNVFDDKNFAIVPKRDMRNMGQSSSSSSSLIVPVVHIVNPISDSYFHSHYHNRQTLSLGGCSVECLFARFAWTLFQPTVLVFLLSSCITSRRVLVYDPGTGTLVMESRNHEQVRAMLAASRSRSASPRKRPASEAVVAAGGIHSMNSDSSPPDSGFSESQRHGGGRRSRKRAAEEEDPDSWRDDDDGTDNDCPRGRPRKRLWEEKQFISER